VFTPIDPAIIAQARRDDLLREAAASRLACQVAASTPSAAGRLAQALRALAGYLDGGGPGAQIEPLPRVA
jgi:hypothetical protein